MSFAVADPLHALSLARTALSDPQALLSSSALDPDPGTAGVTADLPQVSYAITQIDHAIRGLYFEPLDDPAREAGLTLTNLDGLLSSMAEGLDECACFEDVIVRIREAVEHLADARMLLASTRS